MLTSNSLLHEWFHGDRPIGGVAFETALLYPDQPVPLIGHSTSNRRRRLVSYWSLLATNKGNSARALIYAAQNAIMPPPSPWGLGALGVGEGEARQTLFHPVCAGKHCRSDHPYWLIGRHVW